MQFYKQTNTWSIVGRGDANFRESAMAHFDTLITGGKIIDGAGNPGYIGSIGIVDGRIREIGPDVSGTADQVIEAAGHIVAAGIIDIHTHYDAQLHWDPYATNSGWHGTTTIVTCSKWKPLSRFRTTP